MAQLAIKGHENRGKEVIEILEMLGSSNPKGYEGSCDWWYYCIEDNEIIQLYFWKDFTVFTLEEFLEKFPYKVGDRVRVPEYESEVCISKMYWDGNEVQYEVVTDEVEWYSAKELNEFNEPEPNEPNKEKKINQMSLVNCDLDEVEIVLGNRYELKIREGKYYAIRKKLHYPKTYEECCQYLGCDDKIKMQLIGQFTQLINARNAYWKIAGEQMGLDKPWRPSKSDSVYCIFRYKGNIVKDNFVFGDSLILEFPTKEMRDAFFENFGHLIEICKELL